MLVSMRSRLLNILMFSLSLGGYSGFTHSSVAWDGDLGISHKELRYILKNTPDSRLDLLSGNSQERYVFLSDVLSSVRMKLAAESLVTTEVGDEYWALVIAYRAAARGFLEKRFVREMPRPKVDELARERFESNKQSLASIPERRWVSHILIRCEVPCESERFNFRKSQIETMLDDGVSFNSVANLLSDDYASARTEGRLSYAFAEDDSGVDPDFREAAFALTQEGDVSPPIFSKFGMHYVKLEKIDPPHQRDFDDVSKQLVDEIEAEYKLDSLREYVKSFGPTQNFAVNDELFSQLVKAEQDRRR